MSQYHSGSSLHVSKPHFTTLDGLRGVAALAIVVFHFMEWIYSDFNLNFIGHGFLAVDFFFCLSGFVTGYAYDDRLGKMGLLEFFKARIIRLHPLVILGSVLGLLAFLFDPFGGDPALYSTGRMILIFLCSAFLIPFPVMEDRAFNVFGLNAPSWSLFWEYIANILYALVLVRLARRSLILLTVLAAITITYVAYSRGNLLGGWSGETFWDGGARIFYSFLAGLLIYRSKWMIKNSLGFAGLSALLLLAFLLPWSEWNWMTELFIVLFYFPLLVALGAGSTLSEKMRGICVFSGKISYPLYMSHYAVIWIFGHYLTSNKPGPTELTIIVVAGTLLLIGLAYLVMRFYDVPVRKFLSKKRKAEQAEKTAVPA